MYAKHKLLSLKNMFIGKKIIYEIIKNLKKKKCIKVLKSLFFK